MSQADAPKRSNLGKVSATRGARTAETEMDKEKLGGEPQQTPNAWIGRGDHR